MGTYMVDAEECIEVNKYSYYAMRVVSRRACDENIAKHPIRLVIFQISPREI